ncbi:MAG: permease-like cell division protein FtsX [Bacteroidales bacterium]|nr:permease-like cell division protein FtsX [Bacteroidales bacterium]
MSKKRSARISTLGSQITSVISVSLVLLILGILAMILAASHSLGEQVRSNMGFIVKVERGAADVDVNRLKQHLGAAPYVDRYVYSSAEDILAEESRYMGEDLASLVDENPYGAEFDVKVRADWATGDSIEALAARMQADEAVEEVVTETAVIDSVNSVLKRVGWVLVAIAAALLVISFVLINNTVSLAVYSRRFIIHTMKLVGATGGFIRRPFVLAGLVTGAVASVVAIALLSGLRAYAATLDPVVETAVSWSMMWRIFAAVLLTGLIICGLASMIATNRYLRADYDEMFMK